MDWVCLVLSCDLAQHKFSPLVLLAEVFLQVPGWQAMARQLGFELAVELAEDIVVVVLVEVTLLLPPRAD